MKKSLFVIAVLALTAATTTAMLSHSEADSLFEANVEALAKKESEGGKSCETRIKDHESHEVFYCGECNWVDGEATLFSRNDYCIQK